MVVVVVGLGGCSVARLCCWTCSSSSSSCLRWCSQYWRWCDARIIIVVAFFLLGARVDFVANLSFAHYALCSLSLSLSWWVAVGLISYPRYVVRVCCIAFASLYMRFSFRPYFFRLGALTRKKYVKTQNPYTIDPTPTRLRPPYRTNRDRINPSPPHRQKFMLWLCQLFVCRCCSGSHQCAEWFVAPLSSLLSPLSMILIINH